MMEHPFYQKNLVFTGALSTMTRHTAAQKASAFGAVMQGAVTTHTHFVIIGDKRRGISTKHAKDCTWSRHSVTRRSRLFMATII